MGKIVYIAPKTRAREAAYLACPQRDRKLAPSIPHPRSDLALVAKATVGFAVAVLSAVVLLAPAAYATGHQGGYLPWF